MPRVVMRFDFGGHAGHPASPAAVGWALLEGALDGGICLEGPPDWDQHPRPYVERSHLHARCL